MGYLAFCTHSDAGTSGGSGDREGRPMSRVVSGEDEALPLLGADGGWFSQRANMWLTSVLKEWRHIEGSV